MYINLAVCYSTEEYSWLCFRHATRLALKGDDVKTIVDDYGGEGDMRTTTCGVCDQEYKRESERMRREALGEDEDETP